MIRPLTIGMLLVFVAQLRGQEMTYEQAKQRLKSIDLPSFWIGDITGLPTRFSKLEKGVCRVIANSPGGRPLHLVTFGDLERVPHQANFNSAIGGREPAAYLDKTARKKPVILFVGPVHGHEVEALTGLVNLIEIMETGRDLGGRERPTMARLGNRCRLLIIPDSNPDGIARFEPRSAFGMTHAEFQFWGQGTDGDNKIAVWPVSKRIHPRTGPKVGFLGCYFNDDGINPMHDEFFAPMGPEAPAILGVAMEEGPDLAVSLHSHQSKPVLLRPAYLPLEEQEKVIALARRCYELFDARKLPHGNPFAAKAESGAHPAPFNLTSAMYHISGATSFTFECPHGIDDPEACKVTLQNILDIQLSLYEAMMRYALAAKANETVTLDNVVDPGKITAEEPLAEEFSALRAARYLDTAALHWQKTRNCASCHTNMSYLFARPALSRVLKDSGEVRQLFEACVTQRWKRKRPRDVQEIVVVAAGLTFNDLQTTGTLHDVTRQALRVMWDTQRGDGGWNWRNDGFPPTEYDEHYGVTLAALITGIAPDDYAETEEATNGLNKIRKFLAENPPLSLHHRAMIAWASCHVDGLMSAQQQAKTWAELCALQRPDGGWSTPGLMADWKGLERADGKPHDTKTSDAYATGFAIVLAQSGIPTDSPELIRGIRWLLDNQRVSGKWFVRSPARDSRHYFANFGSAFAILALQSCNQLPGWPLSEVDAD